MSTHVRFVQRAFRTLITIAVLATSLPLTSSVALAQGEAPPAEKSPLESTEKQETIEIKGKTTMGELLTYGLTKEQFQEITGIEMPDNSGVGLRDFVTENGLEMGTIKTQIIEALQQ